MTILWEQLYSNITFRVIAIRVIASRGTACGDERSNLSRHFVSLRVVKDREAIFPGNGIFTLPLLEKIASSAWRRDSQ